MAAQRRMEDGILEGLLRRLVFPSLGGLLKCFEWMDRWIDGWREGGLYSGLGLKGALYKKV